MIDDCPQTRVRGTPELGDTLMLQQAIVLRSRAFSHLTG
jgi:hypothetical protein